MSELPSSPSLTVVPPEEYQQFADALHEFRPYSYQIEATLRGHLKYGHFSVFNARLYAPAHAAHRHHLAIIYPAGSANEITSFSIYWNEHRLSDDEVYKLMKSFPIPSWVEPIMVREIPQHLQPRMDTIMLRLSEGELHLFTPMPLLVFMAPSAVPEVPKLPDGYYFGTLDRSYGKEICNLWVGSPTETLEAMSQFLEKLPSVAIFYDEKFNSNPKSSEEDCKVTEELVSYTAYKHGGDLGMTYTKENHRRKGLAQAATLQLASKVREDGLPVFVLIDCENEASIRMHLSMGFQHYTKAAVPFYFPRTIDLSSLSSIGNFEIVFPESAKKWKNTHMIR